MKHVWTVFGLALLVLDGFGQAPATTPTPTPASNQTSTNRGARPGPDRRMDAFYKLGPDSMRQEGVPEGRLDGPKVIKSEVFPGTQHTYWVYVPAQYDA